MLREGEVRIPSGCAISGIFSKKGKTLNGRSIIESIATMARPFKRSWRRLCGLRNLSSI